jgi:hypothetical protein
MTGFTAHCLCGDIALESTADPMMQANCHCDDCRRAGGGVFASYAFVPAEALTVTKGKPASFEHKSDRGSTMTKYFCPRCGSQLYGMNSANPTRRGVRVGAIEDASWFKPAANVYVSRKLPSTLIDPAAKAFDKMPG